MSDLTSSQQAASDGNGGIFTPVPVVDDEGWVDFYTPEGTRLPFRILAAWSSITPTLPIIQIDTEADDLYNAEQISETGEPRIRIFLNDATLHGEDFR
ncbi:MAG: hypothetical protein K0S37_786 [Microbacterium sp.]|jgi:hypothetical protein|nr:hypothetical protein [Microbacterium sp.]